MGCCLGTDTHVVVRLLFAILSTQLHTLHVVVQGQVAGGTHCMQEGRCCARNWVDCWEAPGLFVVYGGGRYTESNALAMLGDWLVRAGNVS